MAVARLNQCTVYQRLDREGVDFPSKTTALITMLGNLIFQVSWSPYELLLFWYPSCRIAGLLRFSDKKR